MTQLATQIYSNALQLDENERAEMAAKLLDSIDPETESDVEAAWGAEIQQRLEEVRTGLVRPIPWSEARKMIMDDADESDAD